MTKTDEAFQEAVLALRDWIDFIDVKERETSDQLERAKRRVEAETEMDAEQRTEDRVIVDTEDASSTAEAGLTRLRQDLQEMGVIDPQSETGDDGKPPVDSWM